VLPDGYVGEQYPPTKLPVPTDTFFWGMPSNFRFPPGLKFDQTTGTISGTPTAENPDRGIFTVPYQFSVQIKSSCGTQNKNFVLSVNREATRQFKTLVQRSDALGLALRDSVIGGIAFALLLNPECALVPVCIEVMADFAAAFAASAIRGYLNAIDPPDPNFTVIAQPVDVNFALELSSFSGTLHEHDALLALLTNLGSQLGLQQALLISINRAQGAFAENDPVWETTQLHAAKVYALRLATKIDTFQSLREAFRNATQAENTGIPANNKVAVICVLEA